MNNVYVDVKCPQCGKIHTLEMTKEQYSQYKSGEGYIQDIFSDWDPSIREMLISGICPNCWNKIFNIVEV